MISCIAISGLDKEGMLVGSTTSKLKGKPEDNPIFFVLYEKYFSRT